MNQEEARGQEMNWELIKVAQVRYVRSLGNDIYLRL